MLINNNSWQALRTLTRLNMGRPHGHLRFAQTIMVKLVCGHSVRAEEINPDGSSWCEICQIEQKWVNEV